MLGRWSVVGVTVVGGRWSVVGGWSVGGGFVLRRFLCIFLTAVFLAECLVIIFSLAANGELVFIFFIISPIVFSPIRRFLYHWAVRGFSIICS